MQTEIGKKKITRRRSKQITRSTKNDATSVYRIYDETNKNCFDTYRQIFVNIVSNSKSISVNSFTKLDKMAYTNYNKTAYTVLYSGNSFIILVYCVANLVKPVSDIFFYLHGLYNSYHIMSCLWKGKLFLTDDRDM